MRIPALLFSLAFASVATDVNSQGFTPLSSSNIHGIANSLRVRIDTYHAPDGRLFVSLGPAVLELTTHSVRSANFQLLVQTSAGTRAERPGPVQSYRGRMLGIQGTRVAGSMLHDGFHARIITSSGSSYWVQPDRSPNSPAGTHLLYQADETVTRGHCGTDQLPNAQIGPRNLPGARHRPESAIDVAEIACDADYEYYADYGSNTSNVTNRIESVINTMNLQYESEVNISHTISSTLIRTNAGSQPYTSSDAEMLLNQMRNHWNANHTNVQRDIAHLFTGKSIIGGTIGIAWIGVICHPTYGYGLVESDFNNVFACATDLSAHELGHNWNAQHCGCRRNTMNASITCANSFHERRTRPGIAAFRDSLSCLSNGGGNATSVSAAVVTSTPGAGQGNRRARAIVTVTDNLGNAVAGATVTGSFTTGIVEGPFTMTTNGSGTATFETSGVLKGKFSATFCVTNVSSSLAWGQPGPVCDSN